MNSGLGEFTLGYLNTDVKELSDPCEGEKVKAKECKSSPPRLREDR